jgi:AhpD family alkylhydroperoxidase
MTARIRIDQVAPGAFKAVYGLKSYVQSAVEPTVLELIKLRASMVNECAFCVDMHSRDALKAGESTQRLFAVAAWRDAGCFTQREQAALALTDAVTRLGDDGVPDDVWAEASAQFTEKELVDILIAIAAINVWNRLNIAIRNSPEIAA